MRTAKTDQMSRLIWVFGGRTGHFVVLSWGGSVWYIIICPNIKDFYGILPIIKNYFHNAQGIFNWRYFRAKWTENMISFYGILWLKKGNKKPGDYLDNVWLLLTRYKNRTVLYYYDQNGITLYKPTSTRKLQSSYMIGHLLEDFQINL